MIPFAILSGEITYRNGRTLTIRILDLSVEGFTFRLGKADACEKQAITAIRLSFYNQEDDREQSICLEDFCLEEDEKTKFYTVYRVSTDDSHFAQASKKLMEDYLQYIDLKLGGDDGALSEALTGYPAKKDTQFPENFDTFRAKLFSKEADTLWKMQSDRVEEVGISLDHPGAWKHFLKAETTEAPFGLKKVTHVYVGNQFCSNLFPDEQTLEQILVKCKKQQLKVVLCFAPMKQHEIARYKRILSWARQRKIAEIVVNDWGIVKLWDGKLTMGILLNKRRKDPRMAYAGGMQETNPLNASFYQNYLKEMGFSRFSFEACGYPYQIPDMDVDFYLPFYQTNTSGHCVMYALCKHGDRGMQEQEKNCPHYCETRQILYPEHLAMVGRYNSIFAMDEQILCNGEYLKWFLDQGVKRLVVQTL